MTQIQTLIALILVLASSVEAVFESFRYVYSNETVELISSPFFQTFAARGINSFVTDSNCSEVLPNLLQPDSEFTNNDVMSIYSMEFVPDNSTLGGYYAFLFQDYQNHLYLRYFYNSVGNLTDVNITTNTGFDFCSTVYNPNLSFVVQVLCVNSSTTQGKSNQTVWKYSVSLPTKTLVSNGSATLQNTNFIKRLTTVSITLGPTIYEMLYEAYSNVFKGTSTVIIFSNSSILSSPVVVDLKLQQGIISADQINKIYSVQPVVDGSCNNCIYVAVGLVSRQISLLRLQLDMTQSPQSVVTNTYPIYIPGYQLDTTAYAQVTAEPLCFCVFVLVRGDYPQITSRTRMSLCVSRIRINQSNCCSEIAECLNHQSQESNNRNTNTKVSPWLSEIMTAGTLNTWLTDLGKFRYASCSR